MVFRYIQSLFTIPETKPITSVLPKPLRDLPPEEKQDPTYVQGRDEVAASCICCYLCWNILVACV